MTSELQRLRLAFRGLSDEDGDEGEVLELDLDEELDEDGDDEDPLGDEGATE